MGKTELLQQWLVKGSEELRSAEYLSTMHYPTPSEAVFLTKYAILPRYGVNIQVFSQ